MTGRAFLLDTSFENFANLSYLSNDGYQFMELFVNSLRMI